MDNLVDPVASEVFDEFAAAALRARKLAMNYGSEAGVEKCGSSWKVKVSPFIRAIHAEYGNRYDDGLRDWNSYDPDLDKDHCVEPDVVHPPPVPRTRPMTVAEFVEGGSGNCPQCGSAQLLYEITELDGKEAWTNTTCRYCDAKWQTTWRLTGYTGLGLPSPAIRLPTEFQFLSAWHHALNNIFVDEISNNIEQLVAYFRAVALQDMWRSQGADVCSSDGRIENYLRYMPLALTHIPIAQIYGCLVTDVIANLRQQVSIGKLQVPSIEKQRDTLNQAGYTIVSTALGVWQFKEASGLLLPGRFYSEGDAVTACFLLQLSLA